MAEGFYQVIVDGQSGLYPAGTPYGEIVKDFQSPDGLPALLVMANGRLRELHKTLKEDCELQFVTAGSLSLIHISTAARMHE